MGYSVECAYCEKVHHGQQTWDDKIEGYVCDDCKDEIEDRFKHQK